jgi:hypothetical protein
MIIVYHGFLYGNYKQVLTDQFNDLILSGLYEEADKVYIGLVDTVNGAEWVRDFWKGKTKVEIIVYKENNELADTMRWVRDYSKANPEDYVLFFHSKGVSHYDLPTEDWRKYMEYFTVERWRDCVDKLNEGYDACGVLWNTDTVYGKYPHFSGAFWWATCKYINSLDHSYLDMDWKYGREMWIGTNKEAKIFEFHNSRMNDIEKFNAGKSHYSVRYDRSNYVKDSLVDLNKEGEYFLSDKGVLHNYLPYYDLMFSQFRDREVNIFEIGYQYKGSLRLWEKYFLYAKIKAIDISEDRPFIQDAKALNLLTEIETGQRVTTEIKDSNSLTKKYFKEIPDIVIDDGSHNLEDQLFVIRLIYPLLKKGGLLIIEDIQDYDNQRQAFEKLGLEFYVIDKRKETGRYDEVLLIFKK